LDVLRLLLDRRLWGGPGAICVAPLVVANAYIAHAERDMKEARRDNLLATHPGGVRAGRARYDGSVGEEPGRYWEEIPDARRQPIVIVSGMSQMYAINDPAPGDEIIAEHLDDALSARGVRAFGLAAPNMNNEEALLYLMATSIEARTRPTSFVYGVCFDKFRNVDLRPGLIRLLQQRSGLGTAWSAACASRSDRYPMACAKMRVAVDVSAGSSPTRREDDVEHRLRTSLGRLVPMIGDSADLNAKAQSDIFLLRNWLFRIKATDKRPMLESVYRLNQELLGLMGEVAQERAVTLVLYVIPLNPAADNPYISEEYSSFKSWLQRFASERGLPFANLENVVPHEDWGLLNGEPDFKHFRERGHQLVAQALLERFGAILERRPPDLHDVSQGP
jgi:hypothetical protein